MKLALALSPCSTVTKRNRAWKTRLSIRQRKTVRCMNRMRVPTRWEATAGSLAAKGPHTGEIGSAVEAWSEQDRLFRQAVTWAGVKANVVVKQVASPVTVDPWEIHETSLMLMECDSLGSRIGKMW